MTELPHAARKSGELPVDRDPKALAKLLAALDQGIAIYGIVNSSNRAKSSITGEVRALLS